MELPRVTGQVTFGGGRKKSQELRGGERVTKTLPWGGGEGWPKGSPFQLRGTVAEARGIKKGREKAAGGERCFYPPGKHRLRVCLRPVWKAVYGVAQSRTRLKRLSSLKRGLEARRAESIALRETRRDGQAGWVEEERRASGRPARYPERNILSWEKIRGL